jgi:hypothetical protein
VSGEGLIPCSCALKRELAEAGERPSFALKRIGAAHSVVMNVGGELVEMSIDAARGMCAQIQSLLAVHDEPRVFEL